MSVTEICGYTYDEWADGDSGRSGGRRCLRPPGHEGDHDGPEYANPSDGLRRMVAREPVRGDAPPDGVPERAGREGDSQPLPVRNDHPDVQSAVIADIEARREVGIRRYGTALQPHNGRNALLDAYEEALDLAMYLKQRLLEDGGVARVFGGILRLLEDMPVSIAEDFARQFRELFPDVRVESAEGEELRVGPGEPCQAGAGSPMTACVLPAGHRGPTHRTAAGRQWSYTAAGP